nr:Uncharacterized protein conserved in bacteria [Streptococcus thermophilus]
MLHLAKLGAMERSYEWEHINDPRIRNEARVWFEDNGLTAAGTQTGPCYKAEWQLDARDNWMTQRVAVDVTGEGWERSLLLSRSASGEWTSETTLNGQQPGDFASPGISASAELAEALDCDLGLCPLTNTMPIRRLGLLDSAVPETKLIMAWIDMPSLQVIASDQYYQSIDSETVRYASGTRGVDVELQVDEDGVVLLYPDMARRV